MKKITSAALAVSAAVLLTSCAGSVDLGGKWGIVSLDGETVKATETEPFLEFNTENNEVHGHTGCNIMNGTYSLDSKKLTFGNMATTMMAGPDMELERDVLDAINRTASVRKSGSDRLQVFDEEGNLLMELQKQ